MYPVNVDVRQFFLSFFFFSSFSRGETQNLRDACMHRFRMNLS